MRQTRPLLARPSVAFLFLLAVVVLGGALALAVSRQRQDRLHCATGPAQWIWLTRDIGEEPAPLRFWAARDFDWGGGGTGPARAVIFVDRRYELFFNGASAGRGQQRPGSPLDLYDVSRLLRRGRNRIEVWAESPDGAGGILFLLALPDGRAVASDRTWRVAGSEPGLASEARPAAVWGRPPMYPWGYPALR